MYLHNKLLHENENTTPFTLPVIFIVETSARMEGDKINTLNRVLNDVITAMPNMMEHNIEIKVSILAYSDHCVWIPPVLTAPEAITLTPFSPSGTSCITAAVKELNKRMCRTDLFYGDCLPPILFLMSGGKPSVGYSDAMDELKQNGWYRAGGKFAYPVEMDSDVESMLMFVPNAEYIFRPNAEVFRLTKKIISWTNYLYDNYTY